MTIQAKHFDTRLNQWIHTDGNTNNPDSLLKEELNNTLVEHFFPSVNFSFGHMDEKSTAEQLINHPESYKLLLSSKTRLLYGPEEYLHTIRQLCPDNKDRGAYGSIFLGSCKNSVNKELNILIVDDSNSENGGVISNDQAYRLTGDCYGQISTDLYHELTKHQKGDKYRVIQHRFGWTDQDGDDNKYRFGKGTLRPANLDQILNYSDPNNSTKIDLILPLSAFKGTDKDNPNGPTKPQIQPGLYKQNIWLGEKSQSELGKTAISQLLASFPNGLKDFTEQLELEAKKLKEAQDDPRQLAQLYCEKYEKRKAFLEEQATTLEEQAAEDPTVVEELETLRDRIVTDSFIYKLIKADLQGENQLLETEKVQREFARFVQNEWKEIAIGKTLTFERAMVIPCKDLQNEEICIPHYQDGEEVLNFRSPFLNSNGLCVSINKIVEDILGPDGQPLAGAIAVSDETSDRIYNRLNKQIKSILPEAQGKNLQLKGIENYLERNISKLETKDKIEFTNKFNEYILELKSAGYELEIFPQESEQERQARDYDGDCIGFERATKYPNLTAEARERNLPENAYDPTVKLKKQSFYQEDGSQPEFEEIAIHMSDGISVGVINNHLTSIEALESEITILKNFGSEKDQIEYVQQVAKHYEDLFKTEAWAKSKGIEGKEVPTKYRGYMEEFIKTVRQEPLNQVNTLVAMNTNIKIYREMIAEAAFQNQIAVDLFKSAKKPEMEIIRNNSRILHREVNYIKDKKKDVYIDNTIQPTGYSPVELLIAQNNQYFEKARLESREIAQFQALFKGVEFSNEQRLRTTLVKKEFDKSFNRASQLSRQKETEKGPSANITLANGNQVSVTNLLQYDNELIWKANKITIKLSEISGDKRNNNRPHKYLVSAQINDETENGKPKFRALGTLAKEQENKSEEIGIRLGQEVKSNKIAFQAELSEGQIKLLYQKAYQIAEEFYNSIPEGQKLAMAAATWAVSTTRESTNDKGSDYQKKVSNFAFAAFPEEIISQLDILKFNDFSITGFDRSSELFHENQPQNIRFNLAEDGKSIIELQNQEGNYETFGNIEQSNARLPIGSVAIASVEKGEVYTTSITTKVPGLPELTFKVGEVNKFGNSQRFNNEPVMLTIEKVDLIREDYSIYLQNGNKPEKLGNIDKESIKEGIAQGWLAEKPGNGQQLQLKIQTIITGQNAYAIAETSKGNFLRINITNPKYKKQEISNQAFKETLVRAFDKKHIYIAKIGDQSLGIIGQHTERLEAELNRENVQRQWQRKESSTVQKLIDTGIIRLNQQRTSIPVQIISNESTCKITINPETVQYPDKWVKRSQLISNEKPVRNEQQEKRNQIVGKINERPTIIFQDKEQKLVGILGLTVDENIADKTKKYLEKVGVSYEQLPGSQARLEAKKGMSVFILDESTMSGELKQTFIGRAGGNIKNANTSSQPTPFVPEQTVYFYNPNQQYSSPDGSQVEAKEALGLVVPAQDAIAVATWLESKSTEKHYFIESHIATFIFNKNEILEEINKELNSLLGEPINIGEVEGFDRYEQLSAELNQKVATEGSRLELNQIPENSEYKKALQALPNRPRELNQEDSPVPIIPAKAVPENNITNIQSNTNATVAGISQVYKNAVDIQVSTNTKLEADNQAILLPNSRQADQTKAIEILGKVSEEKVEQLRSHLETHLKPILQNDKSNYALLRQVAWVGAKWDLKDKDFKPGVQDNKLMELVKQVYPDADIVLVTYSENPGAGINYHRDDSYAATEARSINIGNSDWGYRAAKERMAWTREENQDAPYQEFKLESGTVTRFNCKNEHAALNTEAGRWSINIWSIKNDWGRENSVRQKFENFLASNQPPRAIVQSNSDLTIKTNEWTPGGEIKVERSYTSLREVTQNTPSHSSNQPTVEEIIAIGNSTAARAANPQIPDNPTISGKPVPMVYSLHLHGEPSKVPVNTTIDAMRGHGRIHTTRGVDYQKTYGVKEGDIAIAQGKNGEQVAFRVGKQYKITPEMIRDPSYQQAWAKWEKHSPKELTQTQASKSHVYGLFMEPLGDYVNGKIVPFPTIQKQPATPVNISPESKDGLGVALSLATALAKEKGKLQNDYQVSVNNNPEAPAGRYGVETHVRKPEGVAYASAEQAFNHQKQLYPSADEYKLMVEVLQAKLEQHPRLSEAIAKRGGINWLENCKSITNAQDQQWEGKGKESAFIQALSEAYIYVVTKSQQTTVQTQQDKSQQTAVRPTNPLSQLEPINAAVAEHMKKDIAMAQIATQFIGKPAAPPNTPSSTRNYEQAWGERANTGNYSKDDIIMVSGSGPWRRVTNEQIAQTFENHYKPLLNKAIEAKSSFIVGNAQGSDQLVQHYLQEKGYKVEQTSQGYAVFNYVENTKIITNTISSNTQVSHNSFIANDKSIFSPQQSQQPNIDQALASPSQPRIQQVGAMDNIIERMKANTVQNLQDWYVASEKLGKSETYLNRIHEVTDLYIKENISLENAFKAMERDIKELEKINEMTSLAQSLVKIIGQEDINGIMSVQTEKYQIATKAQDKIYLVKDKNDNILLYIKEGKTQVSNISDETLQDFQLMNLRINNALKDVKEDLVER
ncbi:hypothetical protein [Nostoc favosum]|uniref:Fe2OG dioxygenase domain-containing protein n=1 Tax=Nostoc favosum CHAB5714 TaxID=2780399 RepID=A0ABS8I7S3_9NOSO|nr:hypothetical protein [Nostoc favosum]MCC5599833.1 hypothetical protein [Nostoc favosum CHAB5714]